MHTTRITSHIIVHNHCYELHHVQIHGSRSSRGSNGSCSSCM